MKHVVRNESDGDNVGIHNTKDNHMSSRQGSSVDSPRSMGASSGGRGGRRPSAASFGSVASPRHMVRPPGPVLLRSEGESRRLRAVSGRFGEFGFVLAEKGEFMCVNDAIGDEKVRSSGDSGVIPGTMNAAARRTKADGNVRVAKKKDRGGGVVVDNIGSDGEVENSRVFSTARGLDAIVAEAVQVTREAPSNDTIAIRQKSTDQCGSSSERIANVKDASSLGEIPGSVNIIERIGFRNQGPSTSSSSSSSSFVRVPPNQPAHPQNPLRNHLHQRDESRETFYTLPSSSLFAATGADDDGSGGQSSYGDYHSVFFIDKESSSESTHSRND